MAKHQQQAQQSQQQQQQPGQGQQGKPKKPHPAAAKRGYGPSHATVKPKSHGAEDDKGGAVKHKVKPGDTLWALAERYLGNGRHWRRILAANAAAIPSKDRLRPGIVITIPAADGAEGGHEPAAGPAPAPKPQQPAEPHGAPKKPRQAAGLAPERLYAARRFYDSHPGLYLPHVVRKIQAAIGSDADGVIGLQTIAAIAGWQTERGIEADGIAGKGTCTAMFGRDIRHDPRPKLAPPRNGQILSNPAVENAIDWYRRHRSQYPAGVIAQIEGKLGRPADGKPDGDTVRAIATWQKASGLAADGIAGPATLMAMFGRDIRVGEGPPQHAGKKDDPAAGGGGGGSARPDGLKGIRKSFGEPGTGITAVTMRAGTGGEQVAVRCHEKIADKLAAVFEDIHKDGMSQHIKSYGGCYVYRKKRGNGSSWSTHAWGIAVDVNAEWNPMTSKSKMKVSSDQKLLVPYFERHGFYWGGNFGDPMHFQYCTGY